MRPGKVHFNRRTRGRIFLAAGVLSLAVWLFMATAEICTPLHALAARRNDSKGR